ncbi:NERD domain-containing protein [Evansella halocellulosilytica]|uniref:NERD domain-containing protein n=1 Tax=Evansella halocellulosilytica TaxID=2011013 RepID=UPI000BB91DD0|nr:NERD domain-containing protein [Evansella halocellulosilytica]
MAQLVKLSDYISRYETDIYRYTSRFSRLKKERWDRAKSEWLKMKEHGHTSIFHDLEEEEQTITSRIKKFPWFNKKKDGDRDEFVFDRHQIPKSEEDFKSDFKKEIFQFQLNWASSTISERSFIKRSIKYNTWLNYLLKELPDSYLIFFEPVLFLKKAPVDLDIMILTPTELWLVTPLSGDKNTIYQIESERFWLKKVGERQEKILHPSIQLKRMRSVAEHLLIDAQLSYPIRTAIIAKDSFIDIPQESQRIKLIDKRTFPIWDEKLKQNRTPMKHHQLKVGDLFLQNCLTISESRMELEEDIEEENSESSSF